MSRFSAENQPLNPHRSPAAAAASCRSAAIPETRRPVQARRGRGGEGGSQGESRRRRASVRRLLSPLRAAATPPGVGAKMEAVSPVTEAQRSRCCRREEKKKSPGAAARGRHTARTFTIKAFSCTPTNLKHSHIVLKHPLQTLLWIIVCV